MLDEATGNPALAYVTEMALFAQAPPIYGGTDQVQKNILGERILGLPKEPNNDRVAVVGGAAEERLMAERADRPARVGSVERVRSGCRALGVPGVRWSG